MQEYLRSQSPLTTLTVGSPPFGKIIEFGVPLGLRSGDPIQMTVLVKNTGDLYGSFYIDLWDADTGERLWRSTELGFGPGEQAGFYVIKAEAPLMPNRALELIVQTHHDGEIDDMRQKRIPLLELEQIATALSINIEPSIVALDGSYIHYGRLTRADTGIGLAGELVSLLRKDVEIVQVITDEAGNYSSQLIAPSIPGKYSCQSLYDGNTPLGYVGAVSNTVAFEIPPIALPGLPWWQWALIGLAAVAGIGAIYKVAKR